MTDISKQLCCKTTSEVTDIKRLKIKFKSQKKY